MILQIIEILELHLEGVGFVRGDIGEAQLLDDFACPSGEHLGGVIQGRAVVELVVIRNEKQSNQAKNNRGQ